MKWLHSHCPGSSPEGRSKRGMFQRGGIGAPCSYCKYRMGKWELSSVIVEDKSLRVGITLEMGVIEASEGSVSSEIWKKYPPGEV